MSVLPHVFASLVAGNQPALYLDDNFNALRNVTPTAQTADYTTVVADHLHAIEVTGTTKISLGDAATMVAAALGYTVIVFNKGVGTVTVSRLTGTDTLNGATKDIKLAPKQGVVCTVNSTGNGYELIAAANGVLSDATDPSKQARFDTSGVTAATTRVMTVPDRSGTLLMAADLGFSLINGTLTATQNGTVLTVAVKTLAGNDPSAGDAVTVVFRDAAATTGGYNDITLTAATSIATTVGGTFGVANSTAFRLWVVAFNDGGTFRLGLINCLTTVAGSGAGRDVTAIFPLAQFAIASSTQIGAGSTAAGVFYTAGAAAASKAYATLGYLTYESGLATAGTFGVNQSRLDLFRAGMPLPGQLIQLARNDTGAMATGTTVIPYDDTIPQSTEGDQYMTQAITPSSAANVLAVRATAHLLSSISGTGIVALFQDATANALKSSNLRNTANVEGGGIFIGMRILASLSVATTFKLRAGYKDAGTTTFNGDTGARIFGGVYGSFIEAEEVMA